jgi:uncharacterized protein
LVKKIFGLMRLFLLFFRITLIVFFIAANAGGCGKKAPPVPPDSLVPGEVRNFLVHQDGQALGLQWLIPRVNVDRQPLTDIQGFQVLRSKESIFSTAGCPPELLPLAKLDMTFPKVGKIQGEQVRYRDEDLEPGYRYFYQVIGFDQGGHLGLASPIVSHVWDILPQSPAKFEAKAGDRQVTLTWSPVTLLANGQPLPGVATYNVYRETKGSEFALVSRSPVSEATFQDITVSNDVTYRYLVRTVRQVGKGILESLNPQIQTATPVDLTPPAPVLNLVAVTTDKGIELRWSAGREPDLAGYQVYRRSAAEPQFRLLTHQLDKQPYFVDQDTTKGVTYYYYAVAVDNAKKSNQSLPSETVEVTR